MTHASPSAGQADQAEWIIFCARTVVDAHRQRRLTDLHVETLAHALGMVEGGHGVEMGFGAGAVVRAANDQTSKSTDSSSEDAT